MAWRHRVARTVVEGCDMRFSFKCPREWSSMTVTAKPDIRHCTTCNQHVYYCATVQQAQGHAERGRCVVVDLIPRRRPHDLEPERAMATAGMPAPPPDWPRR